MKNRRGMEYNAGMANLTRSSAHRRSRGIGYRRRRPVWLIGLLIALLALGVIWTAVRAISGSGDGLGTVQDQVQQGTAGSASGGGAASGGAGGTGGVGGAGGTGGPEGSGDAEGGAFLTAEQVRTLLEAEEAAPLDENGCPVTEGQREDRDETPLLGGAELTMLTNQSTGQMMSFLLKTSGGSLIVIDGGRWEDGDHLFEQIREQGGHVSAWLLSHTHTDHVGALLKLLQSQAEGTDMGITVDRFYYNFAPLEWYMVHETGDLGTAGSILSQLDALPQEQKQTVERGDVITVDDVTVTVMNDRYEPDADTVGERDGNDASIAYRMEVNGLSILFLGDLQTIGGDLLLEQAGAEALKSDIVQMAHHGQHGVSEEVYQAIDPDICLWPTPDWLWANEDGSYETTQTQEWMKALEVKRHYCIKDGDQVIR